MTPHAILSTATGLALSTRGAFGSTVLNTVINGRLASTYAPEVSQATQAGLPATSVPALLKAMAKGVGLADMPGINIVVEGKVVLASK
jgi:hypothetical protein